MLEQIDMRDGRDGYVHYRYMFERNTPKTWLTVKVKHEADQILLNEVTSEKLRQPGISTWAYVLRFINDRIAAGWSPKEDALICLTESDAEHLIGKK